MKRLLITITAATAGFVVLAACSSSSSPNASRPSSTMTSMPTDATVTSAHNRADVTFATAMIPHHRQAVEMADRALSRATNGGIKALARDIKAAQDPEITQMSGWLSRWQEPVPTSSTSRMGGMGGMDHSGTGMMSDAEMTDLAMADGAAFDRMWVMMMIRHHRGAVSVATTEQRIGRNAEAKKLAQSIIASQTAQITQLTKLLGKLPS